MTMSLPSPSRCTAWALALLLEGCAVTHVAPPAPVAAPSQFKETGLWQHADANAATSPAVPDQWWQLFNDPELNRLQGLLVVGNENLRAVAAQVTQAKALLGASQAAALPSLSAALSASRGQAGADKAGNSSSPTNNVSLSANASWELDLWGRLGQATDAADARYQASMNDLAAARLSAQATLTQSYFALRAAEAQQDLIERSLTVYQRSLDLTLARNQAGVVAQTDVLQAQTQLRNTQIQRLDVATQRSQLEHAIAVLLGQAPSNLNLAKTAALPIVPRVPALLPATLLQRRPDIAAASQRVSAAYAQIGVAQAAYFPAITLTASAGYRGSSLADLISLPHRVWSLGPALAQSLFDGGVRRSATEQAQALADQASANYRQTVLTALQEVEDNLLLADQLRTQTTLQQEALQFAQRNLEITQDQYRVGTVSYLNVVIAQASALSSERSLFDIRTRHLGAVNQLLKNIAGRWQPTDAVDSGQDRRIN